MLVYRFAFESFGSECLDGADGFIITNMSRLSRRHFVSLLGATAAAHALPSPPPSPSFSFVFLTDSHTEPDLDAVHGTALAMRKASGLGGMDFAIQGGDHVFDAAAVPRERATQLFDLYTRTEQDLSLKVHHTLGNHDVFAIATAPEDARKMFIERFGPTYYSFDHKGTHFVVLDSIGLTPTGYEPRIDASQIDWLARDLAGMRAGTPVVVTTHIPLVTAAPDYAPPGAKISAALFVNGPRVIDLLARYNTLAVLQGHTHLNETVLWRGIPFITSGAVCGNWWHGPRWGTPEGFTVCTVAGGKLTTRYETTGFQSVAPEPGNPV